MKVGFIGAGKVGFSLGKYFKEHGVDVTGYYSRLESSAQSAANFTKTKKYISVKKLLGDSDTIFITVPDDVIEEVWNNIKNLDIKNKNICHCSGSISSTAFFDAYEYGAYTYSVHPLCAISDKLTSYNKLKNTYFTIEGCKEHLSDIIQIFDSLGNKVITISSENKSLYHCGAVMASNLVTGLFAIAIDMLENCGFEKEIARNALISLFVGNSNSIAENGVVKALTGPIERSDVTTIEKHIASIKNSNNLKSKESILNIYLLLSEKLVEIAKEKHLNRDYSKLIEVINNEKHSINL